MRFSSVDEALKRFLKRDELADVSDAWLRRKRNMLRRFLRHCDDNGGVDYDATVDYLSRLHDEFALSTYMKEFFTIRAFLQFAGFNFADELEAPRQKYVNNVDIFRVDDVRRVYRHFSRVYDDEPRKRRMLHAFVLTGATSGMRCCELYALTPGDVDLDERIVTVRKSKTGEARHTFINDEAAAAIAEVDGRTNAKYIFSKRQVQRAFREYEPMHAKHLRKFFSQECDRRGMPFGIKERLLGHSLSKSVDARHYAAHAVDDIRAIYDEAGIRILTDAHEP